MNSQIASLLIVTATLNLIEVQPAIAESAIYVSLKGNDDWTGDSADPNDNHTNGPLRTPEAAMQAVRAMKVHKAAGSGPIHIFLRDGIYYLPKTLRFPP